MPIVHVAIGAKIEQDTCVLSTEAGDRLDLGQAMAPVGLVPRRPYRSDARALVSCRLAAAAALLAIATPIGAQSPSAPALKAAFVYNFAKFAEWPADAVQPRALTICVLGDDAIADALAGTAKGQLIDGREVVVSRVTADGVRPCHVLYLTGLDGKASRELLGGLKGAPVLTVSDSDQFAIRGGIVGLFFEGGKVRFAINIEAARRCRLQISSRLLALATLVKDGDGTQ